MQKKHSIINRIKNIYNFKLVIIFLIPFFASSMVILIGYGEFKKDIVNIDKANIFIVELSKRYDSIFYSMRKFCSDGDKADLKKSMLGINSNKVEFGVKSKLFFNSDEFYIKNSKILNDLYKLSDEILSYGCSNVEINSLERKAQDLLNSYTLIK